jgi:hypothetical protein
MSTTPAIIPQLRLRLEVFQIVHARTVSVRGGRLQEDAHLIDRFPVLSIERTASPLGSLIGYPSEAFPGAVEEDDTVPEYF